jgi:ribosomal protein S18 acetylase RimI-like enzyme
MPIPSAREKKRPPLTTIRRVQGVDFADIMALDQQVTGRAKAEYWRDILGRFGQHRQVDRFFLVADSPGRKKVVGFIIGEIRAWEFGSAPCGWVFALSVDPAARLHGIGEALFDAISVEFRKAGVDKMRTMVARDNRLHLLFFRSEGMMAGPYIQLEKDLD